MRFAATRFLLPTHMDYRRTSAIRMTEAVSSAVSSSCRTAKPTGRLGSAGLCCREGEFCVVEASSALSPGVQDRSDGGLKHARYGRRDTVFYIQYIHKRF